MKYFKKNKLYLIIFTILVVLLLVLVFKYTRNKTTIQTSESGEEVVVTRLDDIPKEVALQKVYGQIHIGSSTKINAHATIQEVIESSVKYVIKVDSGEVTELEITEDTIVSDAWVEVDQQNNVINKSSDDLQDKSKLSGLSPGDRIWIIYEPVSNENIRPEFFSILK